jgi:hypothetical protein
VAHARRGPGQPLAGCVTPPRLSDRRLLRRKKPGPESKGKRNQVHCPRNSSESPKWTDGRSGFS